MKFKTPCLVYGEFLRGILEDAASKYKTAPVRWDIFNGVDMPNRAI